MKWGECVCQLTTSFSIDNDIRVVNWQGVCQLTYKNPCQLRDEMGWMRCQSTTRLIIAVLSIDNAFVNWQRVQCCRLTTNYSRNGLLIDNLVNWQWYKNPCQLREEMGWMHCQSTNRFIITKLSIDSPLNWQHHLHSLSIDNRNHDVCVVSGMACNRCQSTTNKMITELSIDTLLNWKRECDTVSIDK